MASTCSTVCLEKVDGIPYHQQYQDIYIYIYVFSNEACSSATALVKFTLWKRLPLKYHEKNNCSMKPTDTRITLSRNRLCVECFLPCIRLSLYHQKHC